LTAQEQEYGGALRRREMTMTLNTMIPAIRRGLGRARIARSRTGNGPLLRQKQASPLSREETRLAVIEVLG
jgi:hypothetical protein